MLGADTEFHPVVTGLCAIFLLYAGIVQPVGAGEPEQWLGGPEIYTLDWNTRGLIAHDMDGNGLMDLLLINNDLAKIEILHQYGPEEVEAKAMRLPSRRYWQPVLDDGRFHKSGVVTGLRMYAMGVGDLNGDGLPDLAVTDDGNGLTLFFQGPVGEWEDKRRFNTIVPTKRPTGLLITDLNGDGGSDLVVLGEDELTVMFQEPENSRLSPPIRYPLADKDCDNLMALDIDLDGDRDLLYLVKKNRYALRIRLQMESGDFGPERAYPLRPPRGTLMTLDLPGISGPLFAMVQPKSGLIELFGLELSGNREDGVFKPIPRIHPAASGMLRAGHYALDDLDGDGRQDLIIADAKGARIWYHRHDGKGGFAMGIPYPSLSDLRGVTTFRTSAGVGVAVASHAEQAVGIAFMDTRDRLDYPKPIAVEGNPMGIATIAIGGDRRQQLALLLQRNKGYRLLLLEPDPESDGWRTQSDIELVGLRKEPIGMKVVDANQDGLEDLIIFVMRRRARILLQTRQGKLNPISPSSVLLNNLQPRALSSGDIDGDGQSEMLIVGKGFVRAARIGDEGELQVIGQFNMRDPKAELASTLLTDAIDDPDMELLVFEHGKEELTLLKQNRDGIYRTHSRVPLGRIHLVDTRRLTSPEGHTTHLLYLGEDRFWEIPIREEVLRLKRIAIHETDIREHAYARLAFGDLDGNGTPEMVALDSDKSHILELLAWDQGGWRSEMHFPVFDINRESEQRGLRNEPRELLVTDVTNDGHPDVLLLVHERLLLYPSRGRMVAEGNAVQ